MIAYYTYRTKLLDGRVDRTWHVIGRGDAVTVTELTQNTAFGIFGQDYRL